MPVRVNVILETDVYRRIRKQVPPKKLSAFLNEAAKAKLYPDVKALDRAYKAASKERWRERLADDWKVTEGEEWPE